MITARQKEIVIYGFAVLYSVLFFLLVRLFFQEPDWRAALTFPVVFCVMLWAAIMAAGFGCTANQPKSNMWLAILPPFVIPFVGFLSIESLIGGLCMMGALFYARQNITTQINDRIYWNVRSIFRYGVELLLLAALIGVIAIGLPFGRDLLQKGELQVSVQYTQRVLKPFSPIIQRFFPEYQHDATLNNLVDKQVEEQQRQLPPGTFLSPDQRQQAIQQISRQLNISLQGQETIPEIAAIYMNKMIKDISGSVQDVSSVRGVFFTIALIAVIILAIRALLPILLWPVLGLIQILILFARRIGLVTITKVDVVIERLHL